MNNSETIRKTYYYFKPFIPRNIQIWLRRRMIRHKRRICSAVWPIDELASRPPDNWKGWPEGKKFALILTHDVDTARGQERCLQLMKMEEALGFRSSFNFVPERYDVEPRIRRHIMELGFEVGVHGLNHDGKLFQSEELFKERCTRINHYIQEWNAVGFRSPAMLHNLEWIHGLNIEYDGSTFDTDPFEPQSDGVGTIFPFSVHNQTNPRGYIELPYTIPQDFTVFILMKEEEGEIWEKKLDWIASNGGMALLNTHPDYMDFSGRNSDIEEYPAEYYSNFLEYIKKKYEGQYWHVLPREMARYWSSGAATQSY